MVKQLRGKYVAADTTTNVGHIVAAEFYTKYPPETSIKLLVHPSLECLNGGATMAEAAAGQATERGQVAGYGVPVAFTCDSKLNGLNWL